MKEFIENLYANANFPIYLGIIIGLLLVAFFIVLFLGKKDKKKLEMTQRLDKITPNAFKEYTNNQSVEIPVNYYNQTPINNEYNPQMQNYYDPNNSQVNNYNQGYDMNNMQNYYDPNNGQVNNYNQGYDMNNMQNYYDPNNGQVNNYNQGYNMNNMQNYYDPNSGQTNYYEQTYNMNSTQDYYNQGYDVNNSQMSNYENQNAVENNEIPSNEEIDTNEKINFNEVENQTPVEPEIPNVPDNVETPEYNEPVIPEPTGNYDELLNTIESELNKLESKRRQFNNEVSEEKPYTPIEEVQIPLNEQPTNQPIVEETPAPAVDDDYENSVSEDTMAIELPKLKVGPILKEEEEEKLQI